MDFYWLIGANCDKIHGFETICHQETFEGRIRNCRNLGCFNVNYQFTDLICCEIYFIMGSVVKKCKLL